MWEKSSRDMGQNALSQSDSRIFISTISPEEIDEIYFLHFDTNSQKLKVYRKFFGWVWLEIGVAF